MNFLEAKNLCNDNNIFQLNRGEMLSDAIDHIENGTPRKGYKVKADDGRLLTKNEVISNENKVAFAKSFTPAEYNKDEVETIDDITGENDLRDDKSKRGVIINCFYCGDCLRIDGENTTEHEYEDYDSPEPEIHCEGCMSDAILNLAM